MEFRLFGEVRLRAAGQLLDVGTPRQQAVLAALLVDAGRPVPIETLIDRVWGEDPPVEVRNVLYSHLSRIRRLLERAAELAARDSPPRIVRRTAGYVLEVDPDAVDLHRFLRLAERGEDDRGTDADRVAALAEALRSWLGAPLLGIPGGWADRVRTAWHRRRLDAAVRWGELELRLDHAASVISAVPELISEYPLAEPLEAVLMRALHAAGRHAEAIDRYAEIRQRLADELGTGPGPELRALYHAILRGELPARSAQSLLATPAQLPPDTDGFAGREVELRRLDDLVEERSTTLRIAALSGTAGVGKTALAIHWAHTVRDKFPGGQLYVNLRGYDPRGSPVAPVEAVRGFLEAFEVPAERIPTSFEAQVGLYRSLLASRQVLVLLDNARDAEQARSLLPGAPGSLVLVTSRDWLAGLIAVGAHLLTVDLLDNVAAHAVLIRRTGAGRVAAEPAAADEIIRLCARLPLALAVVAARAQTHPRFSLAALAGQLRDAGGGLDEFAGADPALDPRAVFSWSYRGLSAPAARLFRLLGLHPGPDIGTRAAASLAGLPVAGVRAVLSELAWAHLITEQSPGRYGCHDLLRAYASELVQAQDSAADREQAVRRVLGYYAHSAYHADGFLDPRREVPPTLTALPPGVEAERIVDRRQALAWFAAEHRVLVLAVRQDAGYDTMAWELAWSVRRFLAMQGHWHDEIEVLTVALAAARRLGDVSMQAFAHCYLGCTYIWFNEYERAHDDLTSALEFYQVARDIVGQAYVHHYFSWRYERQDRIVEALPHAEQALTLFRAAEHQAGQAKALNAVGWFHALLGEYPLAIEHCQPALDLQIRLGDELSAAQTWHSLGYSHERLGDQARAVECYEAAVEMFHRTGYLINEAHTLTALADIRRNAGDLAAARAGWQQAYDILDQLGHSGAGEVRAKLRETNTG
jgi:DNA-binding SARP family transcriptional activator/tetratricopeptide (TPR) repeat protein